MHSRMVQERRYLFDLPLTILGPELTFWTDTLLAKYLSVYYVMLIKTSYLDDNSSSVSRTSAIRVV